MDLNASVLREMCEGEKEVTHKENCKHLAFIYSSCLSMRGWGRLPQLYLKKILIMQMLTIKFIEVTKSCYAVGTVLVS